MLDVVIMLMAFALGVYVGSLWWQIKYEELRQTYLFTRRALFSRLNHLTESERETYIQRPVRGSEDDPPDWDFEGRL